MQEPLGNFLLIPCCRQCYSKDIAPNNNSRLFDCVCHGRGRETRTPGTRFWRPLLNQPGIGDFTPFSGCFVFLNITIDITILLKKDKSS